MTDPSRRFLFRSAIEKWLGKVIEDTEDRVVTTQYMRPPGALPEIGFLAACSRCGACSDVCPPKAIRVVSSKGGLAAGTPYIDAGLQPCTVCPDMPCVTACPTGALTMPEHGWRGYRLAELGFRPDRCITFHGSPCRVCADACPMGESALAIDDQGHPVLRWEGCVGCGVCVRACVTTPSSYQLTLAEG
jgi:ferredoxin-type protein NapG/ferredoxin-type protein NapH